MEAKAQGMSIVGFAVLVAAYLTLNSSLNLLVGPRQSRAAAGTTFAVGPPPCIDVPCSCHGMIFTQLQNKWALGVYGFRFPFMLTSAHSA